MDNTLAVDAGDVSAAAVDETLRRRLLVGQGRRFRGLTRIRPKTLRRVGSISASGGGVDGNFIAKGVVPMTVRPLRLATEKFGLKAAGNALFVRRLTRRKNIRQLTGTFAAIGTEMRLVIMGGDGVDPPYGEGLWRRGWTAESLRKSERRWRRG